MKIQKRIVCILLACLLVLSLAGCKGDQQLKDIAPKEIETLSSDLIDENDRFTLSWDEDQYSVLLTDKKTSKVWSTVPYDFFTKNEEPNASLNSPIYITYYNPSDGSKMVTKALGDCIEKDNLSVTAEDGTIKMEFYFEEAQLVIPLSVSLTKSGMKASLEAKNIRESGKTELVTVSVLPYLCSAPNTTDKSNYLFVPVGSGALVYTDDEVQEIARTYTGEVYGTDAARLLLEKSTIEESIHLPVFGAKNGNDALFAIIEDGAESASINVEAGSMNAGFSAVYASFNIRSFDETEVERDGYNDALIYSKAYDKNAVYTVSYNVLTDDKADYVGMAEFYRDYLKANNAIYDSDVKQSAYNLSFLGGTQVRDVMVGIPYHRGEDATSFAEAQDIIGELVSETNVSPSVLLKGFDKDGVDPTRIAGGFGFSSSLGGNKGYNKLLDFCKEKDITLSAEYNIVQYSKSGGGFTVQFSSALTPSRQVASAYPLKKNIRSKDETFNKIAVLSRTKLDKAVDKLLDKAGKVSGYSLSTLGNMAYSDYRDVKYYAKNGMGSQVTDIIKKVRDKGHTVNMGAANGYAAAFADSVTDVPMDDGEYFALDQSVPFYQILFHGYTAMYTPSLNLATNETAALLKAVESGISPSFVLSANPDSDFADTLSNEFYGSIYSGNKEALIKHVKDTSGYFEKVGNLKIKDHKTLNGNNVTFTEFEDGTKVWVNHSGKNASVDGKTLKPYSFCYTGKSGEKTCVLGGEQ